ncbi:MAG TPA: AI-2E family transporter [Sphingobacteriaceae bacterium]
MQQKEHPFYLKTTIVLFGLVLFVHIITSLRDILIPIAFAAVIGILLNPIVNRLQNRRIPKLLSILLGMLIGALVIGGILYFLSSQIIRFGETLPVLRAKFTEVLHEFQQWLLDDFGITVKRQVEILNNALSSGQAVLGRTLGSVVGTIGVIFLIPVYVFMMLFYKPLILNFFYDVFEEYYKQVGQVLGQTKTAIQSYMVGLLIEAFIVATLQSIALTILGVDYAILFGVIGGILNLLPYIGNIIATILPLLMATVTKEGYSTQLGILAAYAFIQFLDNNILVPRIVSSKVKINAFVSIVAVLLGGAAWGIPGLFLSIPFVAILKIVFDRVDGLKPWGKLLGDDIPGQDKGAIERQAETDESVAEGIVNDTEKENDSGKND